MPHPTQARTRLPDHTWQSHSSREMAQVFVPKAQEFVLTRPEGFSLQTTDLQHVGSQRVDDYLDLFNKTNFESKVKMGKFIGTLRPLDNATIPVFFFFLFNRNITLQHISCVRCYNRVTAFLRRRELNVALRAAVASCQIKDTIQEHQGLFIYLT